jgi:hypothetical protein
MAKGWRKAVIYVGLCAGLLPGCALFGLRHDQEGAVQQEQVCHLDEPEYLGPYPPVPREPPRHETTDAVRSVPTLQTNRQTHSSADEVQNTDSHPEQVQEKPAVVVPVAPPPSVVLKAAPQPEKKEPLLEALECFLKDQPQRALELLKGYQPSSQDIYISLLPVLAELTHKGVDQLSPEEVSAIHEELESLADHLRSRAKLVIDRMCLCRDIKGYGVYTRLPEGHVFRAGSRDEPGEPVQLYVELRNFSLAECPHGYITRLSSSVEICDEAGKQQWFHNFKEQEKPLIRQAPWHDCFGNYCFYVPFLPPGVYTLTVTIRDKTRPETPRVAHKSLTLRVG